jgi:predicted metal-binding membrane protein
MIISHNLDHKRPVFAVYISVQSGHIRLYSVLLLVAGYMLTWVIFIYFFKSNSALDAAFTFKFLNIYVTLLSFFTSV